MTNERAVVFEPFKPSRFRGVFFFCVAASVSTSFTAPAWSAGDTDAQCVEAYADGQRARRAGELKHAQQSFVLCGGESCPGALHGDCLRWLDEVEAAMPTAVFQISSTNGERLVGVQVRIDGGPASKLDGRALAFDPGEHVVSFELAGHRSIEQRLSFSEGEKLVVREVTLEPVDPPSARPAGSASGGDTSSESPPGVANENPTPTTLPIWIGAGVGALGLAGFSYFALSARSQDQELGRCYPACPVEQVARVERAYRNANVSLGVGAVGVLVAAAWWVFASPSDADGAANQQKFQGWGLTTTGLSGRF